MTVEGLLVVVARPFFVPWTIYKLDDWFLEKIAEEKGSGQQSRCSSIFSHLVLLRSVIFNQFRSQSKGGFGENFKEIKFFGKINYSIFSKEYFYELHSAATPSPLATAFSRLTFLYRNSSGDMSCFVLDMFCPRKKNGVTGKLLLNFYLCYRTKVKTNFPDENLAPNRVSHVEITFSTITPIIFTMPRKFFITDRHIPVIYYRKLNLKIEKFGHLQIFSYQLLTLKVLSFNGEVI